MPTSDREKDFEMYSFGLCYMSVCSSLSAEETVRRANQENPTGTHSDWAISENKTFKNGEPMPCPCDESPKTHKHYLLNC